MQYLDTKVRFSIYLYEGTKFARSATNNLTSLHQRKLLLQYVPTLNLF